MIGEALLVLAAMFVDVPFPPPASNAPVTVTTYLLPEGDLYTNTSTTGAVLSVEGDLWNNE